MTTAVWTVTANTATRLYTLPSVWLPSSMSATGSGSRAAPAMEDSTSPDMMLMAPNSPMQRS